MQELYLILYVCATLCFALFSFGVSAGKVHLLGLGVMFWSLVPLVQVLNKL